MEFLNIIYFYFYGLFLNDKMIKSYLKYFLKATNQHGVHSPFVYNLVTKCLYQKNSNIFAKEYSKYKKSFSKNHQIIRITDFGAGSKIFTSNQRKVKDILNIAATKLKYAALLNRLVNYLNVKTTLELGTSLGVGTFSLAFQNNNVKIDSIEGCHQIATLAQENFKKYKIDHQIQLHTKTFDDFFKINQQQLYDLIFIDGHHQKEATIQYFNQCLQYIHNDSVIVLDDIYWSDGMKEAWSVIKNHPQVTVSIDLFQFGLVFFRKEQVKQHFKIRF